jgi:spermidine/putrescine transport system ATP-binding protein
MEWIVELTDVTKRHGSTPAVDRLSLRIRRGEFFSILGPSGSGKTTTLRLLAGFDEPDEGAVFIDGRPMGGVPPQRRPVNTVFQQYALFPHMTVADNVAFGLKMRGEPGDLIRARVGEMLALVKLEGKAARYPAALSGGEQQRAALARALVNKPAVLLLDEPMAALDQQLRRGMQVELKALQSTLGMTFVCVTHHQEEALMLSDRIAVMREGRLLQVGEPRELYERPAQGWVAEFIGLSNAIHGLVAEVAADQILVRPTEWPDLGLLKSRSTSRRRAGDSVSLLVRPEHLRLARDPVASPGTNQVRARVAGAFYGGATIQYRLVLRDRLDDRLEWTACVPAVPSEDKPFAIGETLWVSWSLEDGLLIPAPPSAPSVSG